MTPEHPIQMLTAFLWPRVGRETEEGARPRQTGPRRTEEGANRTVPACVW